MNRWLAARVKAYEVRNHIEAKLGRELYGRNLIDAIFEDNQSLTCLECLGNDPLLGNEEQGYDQARYYASEGFVVVSQDLPDEETRTFYKTHELGHHFVHTRQATCRPDDVDPTKTVLTLPYAEGRIATYHPRQMQESEATVFASELLVPSHRLAEWFDKGENASELAARFQVPRYVILSQMATVLLAPPLHFEELLTLVDSPAFHWKQLDDDSQKPACCAPKGPVLVDAGPGTGKTRTLTSRIEWLIEEQGIAPEKILALTFSNRATEELRFRLRQTVPHVAHQVTVATFHGFGLELLKRYSDFAGYSPDVVVVDPVEAELLLEENLARLELVYFSDPALPNRYLADILAEISRAKESLVDPDGYMELVAQMRRDADTEEQLETVAKCQEIGHVYREYEELLRENNLLDYGDLVMKPVRLFASLPEELAQLRSQYDHILVDEYQDINHANGTLVQLLAGEEGVGLWAVGDLRQSIYRFRGASPAYIRRFREHYPRAKVYPLQINYRASGQLVNFARRVAAQVSVSLPVPEWQASQDNQWDSSIRVAFADDKNSEMKGMADCIRELVESGARYGEIAVLCRTNAQAGEIARVLGWLGIPTMHLGKFFFRREVKDLLAVLSLVIDSLGVTWPRVAALIRDPISAKDVITIWNHAYKREMSFPSALRIGNDTESKLDQSQREDLDALAAILSPYTVMENPNPWLVIAEFLFEFGHYLRRLRNEGVTKKVQTLLAIGQLLNLARAFGQRTPAGSESNSIKAFSRHVRRLIERDDNDVDLPVSDVEVDAVRILTIHKSKGLEFPVVFVPNLAKDRFPSRGWRSHVPRVEGLEYNPEPYGDILDEERCLFVAITRAKQHLILSRAESYHLRLGKPVSRKKSELWRLLDGPLGAMGIAVPTEKWTGILDLEDQSGQWQEAVPVFLMKKDAHLEMRAMRVFQRCPRQFFYRYVLGLTVPDMREIYLQFTKMIYSMIDWLHLKVIQAEVPTWETVVAKLDEEYKQQMPEDHIHARWYRREAEVRLKTLWGRVTARDPSEGAIQYRQPAAIEVQGLVLEFHLDEVFDQKDKRTVTRYKTGGSFRSHLEDPYLPLYRMAAREGTNTPVRVNLSYLATGEVIEVPSDRDEKILSELETRIENLRKGDFPPQPSDSRYWRTCSGCSYLFICPIGEDLSG